MKNLFKLPEEYEVKKKLTKKQFLGRAHLTSKERETINTYLDDIDVVYDFLFSDKNEIILVEAEVRLPEMMFEIARIIAQVIPHNLIIYTHYGYNGQLFIHNTKKNQNDSYRRVIINTEKSWKFRVNKLDYYEVSLFDEIGSELLKTYNNSKKVVSNCIGHIIENADSRRAPKNTPFKIKRTTTAIQEIKPFTFYNFLENRRKHNVPLYGIIYTNGDIEYDLDDWEDFKNQELFMISTCNSAYSLYEEAPEQYDEDDWLILYERCCSTVFGYTFYEAPPDCYYENLEKAFFNQCSVREECYYVDLVIELLEQEYYLNADIT